MPTTNTDQELRFIRGPKVQEMTGLSRSSVYRLEESGDFPKRRQISEGVVAWVQSEIFEWMRSRERRFVKAE